MTAALELREITKSFGGAAAIEGVSLAVEPGEVLALVGENGAGKSTLVNVACGVYRQDSGSVRSFDAFVPAGDPRAAIAAGIGAVHQHFMLVGPLRVWENVVLGREPRRLGFVDVARARREVRGAAEAAGLRIDVDARVESLGAAAQQRVEIVKQIWRGAKIVLLDEPTSLLSPLETADLLRTVRGLAASGRSVLFISHKLREVMAVADRVAVLRRGRLVAAGTVAELDVERLSAAVMGTSTPAPPEVRDRKRGSPRLECVDVRTGRLRGATFTVGAGEILGIAGVEGNGQAELFEALSGLRPSSGKLRLDGSGGAGFARNGRRPQAGALEGGAGFARNGRRPQAGALEEGWSRTPRAARRSGVVHLPDDPRRRALCLPLTCEENLALGRHTEPPYARGAFIDGEGRRAKAIELIRSFDVRPPDPLARPADLSGGNQQKLVAARELEGGTPPRLVVAAQPSRGLDLVATRRVHEALCSAASAGAAVVVISSDLDELRSLCDRIAVLFEGRILGEADPSSSDETLGRLMLGHGGHAA
ncbi:MAG: ABC transporter ATP-binding protein [Myxococcales bacterium]